MSASHKVSRIAFGVLTAAVLAVSTGCATYHRMMGHTELSGANEMPSVSTKASGVANIKVNDDRTVSGKVTVSGMTPTAAHIHEGGPGKNGPVIIPLKKTGSDTFVVPAGAKFTVAQYNAYKAGDMYVNVHSAVHKGGEVRGQLKP